jgi:hypothetical protein
MAIAAPLKVTRPGRAMSIMQMFNPERGELRLLGYRGFAPAAAAFWEWVGPGSGSICGAALATGARSIVPDIELCVKVRI